MRGSTSVANARRAPALAVALLVVGLATAACGTEEDLGDGAGRPSLSPTRTASATLPGDASPTADRPTVTRPTVTRPTATEPSATETTDPEPSRPGSTSTGDGGVVLPTPTRSPGREETPTPPPEEPEGTQTPEAPAVPTGPTATGPSTEAGGTPSSEATTETSADADETDEESSDTLGLPPWVWWVLVAVVVASAVAMPWVLRARRRNSWRQELATQEEEVAWLARELVPELRDAASPERATGGWAVARVRVVRAEDQLTVLSSAAPDEAASARATQLRDAVRHARTRLDGLDGQPAASGWTAELDDVAAELEASLRTATYPPG